MVISVYYYEGFFDIVLVYCHLLNFYFHILANYSLVSKVLSIDYSYWLKPTDNLPLINYLSIFPNFQSFRSGTYFFRSSWTFSFTLLKRSEPSSYSKGFVFTPEKLRVAKFIFDFSMCCFYRTSRFSIKSSKLPEKK